MPPVHTPHPKARGECLILQGDRTMPPDFEARVNAALDRLEEAEEAAAEARARVLDQDKG